MEICASELIGLSMHTYVYIRITVGWQEVEQLQKK